MKNLLLSLTLALIASSTTQAQVLFADAQFDVTTMNGIYGQNWTILPALRGDPPIIRPMNFTAYMPMNTPIAEHPVVVVNHTGSFLPPLANGGYTGSINDSVVVNVCKQLASRGFIAIAANYRAGWNPIAQDQEVRTSTLLQAAYRGQQDLRMMMRYLRKQYAEDNNPLMVDTSRMAAWGIGTGGYNVVNANCLDAYQEVLLPKFIGSNGAAYINPAVHGDVNGVDTAVLNLPNHVDYVSTFHFAVNSGGALGDSTWLDGTPDEAPIVGIQAQFDPFAPFYAGGVIVPTTGQFVVDVAGGLLTVDRANRLGTNDALIAVNTQLRADSDPITLYADSFNDVTFTTREGAISPLSVDNFLPRVGTASLGLDFVDFPTLEATVAGYNAATGDTISAARLVGGDQLTNPNTLNPTAAKAALDTVIAFVLPRMSAALNLADIINSATDLTAAEAGLVIAPNPASSFVNMTVESGITIEEVRIINIQGQTVLYHQAAQEQVSIDVANLPQGIYVALLTTDKGTVAQQLAIK